MNERNANSIEEILTRGKSVRLSDFEKGEMRKSLINTMETTSSRPRIYRQARALSWSYLSMRVSVASLLVLFLGAGTSFAAQSAVPGDALYPIKVGVNEKVEIFLARSQKALAEVTAKHALTRLTEAETLASEGKLDPKKKSEVEQRFYKNVADLRGNLKKLEGSGDYAAATNVSSSFEEGLGEHLGAFVNLSGNIATATPEVAAIADSVGSELQSTQNERVAISEREISEAATTTLAQVRAASDSAQKKIADVEAFVSQSSSSTPSPVSAVVTERLSAAEELFARAVALQNAGSYGEAFALFREVQSQVQDVKLLTILGTKVKRGLTVRSAQGVATSSLTGFPKKGEEGSGEKVQVRAELAPQPKAAELDINGELRQSADEKSLSTSSERRGIKIQIDRDGEQRDEESSGVHLNIDL